MVIYMNGTTHISQLNLLEEFLNKNDQLNFDIKVHLKRLMTKIVPCFPDLKWAEISQRFATLSIEKISPISEPGLMGEYYPVRNAIRLNVEAIKDESVDLDYLIGVQLVKLSFSHGNYWGFNSTGEYKALNEGYASILTQNIIGNDGEYVGEENLLTNLLSIMVGNDAFLGAFKSGNPAPLKNRMVQQGIPEENFVQLNQKLTYNMDNRNTRLDSSFPNLQLDIVRVLQSGRSLTKEEQNYIKLNAIGSSRLIYTPGIKYQGLEGTYLQLKQLLAFRKNNVQTPFLNETLENTAKKVM